MGCSPSLPAVVDLAAYHGDTFAQQFRFLEGTAPVDLTGATVESWALNGSGVVELTVTVGPDAGVVTLTLPPAMPAGRYRYDVEVIAADTSVTTWVRGLLEITDDITNG